MPGILVARLPRLHVKARIAYELLAVLEIVEANCKFTAKVLISKLESDV